MCLHSFFREIRVIRAKKEMDKHFDTPKILYNSPPCMGLMVYLLYSPYLCIEGTRRFLLETG